MTLELQVHGREGRGREGPGVPGRRTLVVLPTSTVLDLGCPPLRTI